MPKNLVCDAFQDLLAAVTSAQNALGHNRPTPETVLDCVEDAAQNFINERWRASARAAFKQRAAQNGNSL